MTGFLSSGRRANLASLFMVLGCGAFWSCSAEDAEDLQSDQAGNGQVSGDSEPASLEDREYARHRTELVDHLRDVGIANPAVLEAMQQVPRHRFVPERLTQLAYVDRALPIGRGQTISQPYIVALMTQLVEPKAESKALDVGTGSGYQAAVLAEIVDQVYSIEIVKPLADEARARLEDLGYENIEVRCGDGYRGWPEEAPFDVIVLAAAPDHIPQPLIDQLAPGGKLVLPVGERDQNLTLVTKDANGDVTTESITPVVFVPMTGEARDR